MLHSLDYIQKTTISEAYGNTSQVVLVVKNLPANAGYIREVVSIPGPGRSPGGGKGNPLQYSCLEKLVNREVRSLMGYSSQGCKKSDTTEAI